MPTEDIIVEFEKLYEHQQDIIFSIRQYCLELRSPILSGENLESSIMRLIDNVHMQSNIEVSAHIIADLGCTPEIEGHLFRIVQELLRNAMKHSEATQLKIKVHIHHEHIHIEYDDNGVGMDINSEFTQKRVQHMGLSGLYYRTEILGGKISIESELDNGVRISIHIPNAL